MDEEKCGMLADERADDGAASTPEVTTYNPNAKTPLSKKAFWRVLLSIEISMLAIAVDIYSTPVAVPLLPSDVLGYLESAWLGTAFLAAFALGFFIWPRLCRGFGYRFSFVVAIEVYNLAAARVPTSKTAGRMIAMRALSGAGAGGTYGLFEMIIQDIIPPKEFKKYMSLSRMMWAVAAVGSQLASGALADHELGPLCFDLGSLLGTIGYLVALAVLNLPEPSWTDTWSNFRRFDYLGTICLTAGTFCVLLVPTFGGSTLPWISGHPVGFFIAGLALLVAFFFIQPLVPDPLVHPSLFLDPGLLIVAMVAFFYGANLYGTLYYVPQFYQLVLQDGALVSSISTMPMILAMAVGSASTTLMASTRQISSKIGHVGIAIVALASGLMVRWSINTGRGETVVVLGILGLGQGTALIGLLHRAQAFAGHITASSITRLFTFFGALGSSFGVACFAALYTSKLQSLLGAVVPDVAKTLADMGNLEDEYVAGMRPRVRDAYESGMQAGWWLIFGCALAVLALSCLMELSRVRHDGDSRSPDNGEKLPEVEKGF